MYAYMGMKRPEYEILVISHIFVIPMCDFAAVALRLTIWIH